MQIAPNAFFPFGQADCTQAPGKRNFSDVTADYCERDDPELLRYIALSTLPRRGVFADFRPHWRASV